MKKEREEQLKGASLSQALALLASIRQTGNEYEYSYITVVKSFKAGLIFVSKDKAATVYNLPRVGSGGQCYETFYGRKLRTFLKS